MPPLLDHLDLAARLMLDHRHDEADRIDVLGLGPRAEFAARLAHADVDVGAHRAFFHIAVARADIAQDRAQLAQISPCFGGRTHVGPRDDLHQRDARAVEIDIGHRRMLVVHQLARVLLDMDALDADRLGAALVLLVEQDLDLALADQRVVELADLIALRQIGVEIILAVEPRPVLICASSAMPVRTAWRMHSRFGTGSMPGIAASTRLTCAVRLGAERGRGAGEQLGVGGDLGVDLEADHDLPLAGFALDPERCDCVSHYHHFSGRAVNPARSSIASAGVQHALLVERLADELQAERQALPVEPAGHRHRRQAGEARRHREHVVQIHRQRIGRLLADAERGATARSGSGSRRTARTPASKSRAISARTFCALVK